MFYCLLLQDMEAAFHTNATASAAIIACFVFAVGVSSLAWGPFCDLLGRKPTYLASTTMYAAATVGCIFAHNIQMMLAFRTLQGAACKCVGHSRLWRLATEHVACENGWAQWHNQAFGSVTGGTTCFADSTACISRTMQPYSMCLASKQWPWRRWCS